MPLLSLSVYQLLLAFAATNVLRTLTFNRFFLRWLTSHKLACYLPPTNNEIRQLVEKGSNGNKKNKSSKPKNVRNSDRDNENKNNDVNIKVPAQDLVNLKLEKKLLKVQDIEKLHYATDLEWIVDLGLMSMFCCTLTQVQFHFYPDSSEWNFSVLWALLVVLYCAKVLSSLTATYFRNDDSIGERSICIVSACVFLLIAMCILIADERYLGLGLEKAHHSISQSISSLSTFNHENRTLADQPNFKAKRSISVIFTKFTVAMVCSFFGVIFTFPGFRFGQLHETMVNNQETGFFLRSIYLLNFVSPLFIACLWLEPVSRFVITRSYGLIANRLVFDLFRISCIITLNVARIYIAPRYIAVFLASSSQRMERLRHRGGTTNNQEIQAIVTSIFNYVNVVTIQYVLPALMCLFASVILLSTGAASPKISDTTSLGSTILQTQQNSTLDHMNATDNVVSSNQTEDLSLPDRLIKLYGVATTLQWSNLKKILSPDVSKGIFGFATWWLHFAWFCTTATGVLYHKYFVH